MNPSPPPFNAHDPTPDPSLAKPVSEPVSGAAPAAPNGDGQSQAPSLSSTVSVSETRPNETTDAAVAPTEGGDSNHEKQSSERLEDKKEGSDDKKEVSDDKVAVASAVPGRIPTPSSRTSTPPLAAAAKKKFSSVSVNKEFLSKAVSPAPVPAKPRPVAAAAPTQSSSARLLSSKLTTVPSSKPTTSPKPTGPPAAASTTASPWAKPSAPPPEAPTVTSLQHPAPTRHGLPNVAMGSGQGLGSGNRRAWGPIGGGRSAPFTRDFPTAKEVADGKRAALMVAQAEAAHNQAILAGLNEFTHLEPNAHRWDEEDDDDEPIDFGDGHTYVTHKDNEPVAKTERFADDFDRSWPRRPESPQRSARPDGGRVLFNASSNRLEPQQTSTTRLMPREQPPSQASHGRDLPPHTGPAREREVSHGSRQPPPHLGGGTSDRMLPPHLQSAPGPAITRQSWRAQPNEHREAPLHVDEHRRDEHRREHQQPSHYPTRERRESRSDMPRPIPSRAPPAHQPTMRPPAPPSHHSLSPASTTAALPQAAASANVAGEVQAAEMHSAAEKARLRRLAEETEREAAAERARRKARELAERFGDKTDKSETATSAAPAPAPAPAPEAAPMSTGPTAPPPNLPKPPPPPGLGKPTPQITIATRPRADVPSITGGESRSADPQVHPSERASSWRRTTPLAPQPHSAIPEDRARGRRPSNTEQAARPRNLGRDAPPRDMPPHSLPQHPSRDLASHAHGRHDADGATPTPVKKEADWDAMLARLQAAMAKAKTGDEDEALADNVKSASIPPRPTAAAESSVAAPAVPLSQPIPSKPKRASSKLPHLPPDYFNATEAEIPKSPPPAWRQYTVKIPTQVRRVNNIPRWRLKAAEGPRPLAPAGWIMTFDPPIANLPRSLSIPDLLLPQPIGRRFPKHVEAGPIVSISPRTLTKFERRPKQQKRREERSEAAQQASTHPSVPEPSQTEPMMPSPATPATPAAQPKRSSKTEKDRRFLVDGDTVAPTDKPAVRFMVSSELDGDSLLDEVNKMSLEHMGELEDKGKTVVHKRPATPPSTTAAHPATSPSATSGPWAKSALVYPVTSPARGATQHEHLKSVWDTAADSSAAVVAPTAPASAPSQPETPLYPTLSNPVPPSDSGSNSLKPISPMQPGSSPFSMRTPSLGQAQYQYPMGTGGSSPDGGMGMQYGLMGRTSGGSTGGGSNGFQQGVWSSSFGSSMATPGYYGQNKDQKPAQFTQSTKDGSSHPYNDFRYPQQQQQQGGNGFQPQPGAGGFNGYPSQQFRSPNVHYGGYGAHSGFGTQMAGPRPAAGSRFPGVGVTVDYQMGYDPNAGYYSGGGVYTPGYGGVGSVGGVGGVGSGGGGVQQGGRGAVGRKMW